MIHAVYVHQTTSIPYADAIVHGLKPIETRSRDTLGGLVGEIVLVVRTSSHKPAEVVGLVQITGKVFLTAGELDGLRDQTLIPPGSSFDCHGRGKWCYHLAHAIAWEHPIPLDRYTTTHRNRSYCTIDLTKSLDFPG